MPPFITRIMVPVAFLGQSGLVVFERAVSIAKGKGAVIVSDNVAEQP